MCFFIHYCFMFERRRVNEYANIYLKKNEKYVLFNIIQIETVFIYHVYYVAIALHILSKIIYNVCLDSLWKLCIFSLYNKRHSLPSIVRQLVEHGVIVLDCHTKIKS